MKILTLDTETTGTDPHNAHLVTLFLGVMEDDGTFSTTHHYVFNPGVEIPVESSNVHGITTAVAVEQGVHPDNHAQVLTEIVNLITYHTGTMNLPLVAYNAPFDLTLLNATLTRLNMATLDVAKMNVIDPFVIDKHLNPYRKGPRNLTAVATHYGISVNEDLTHTADYDCYLAGRVAQQQLNNPTIAAIGLPGLQTRQAMWKQEQSLSLQTYLRKAQNNPTLVVNPEWPVQAL